MFMGLLHHRMHKLNSGLGNSNAVERIYKTKPGLDAHQMVPMKKRDLIGELRGKK